MIQTNVGKSWYNRNAPPPSYTVRQFVKGSIKYEEQQLLNITADTADVGCRKK